MPRIRPDFNVGLGILILGTLSACKTGINYSLPNEPRYADVSPSGKLVARKGRWSVTSERGLRQLVIPLFFRALLAFLALPLVVAGLVPWWLLRPAAVEMQPAGIPLLLVGLVLLLWCVRDFYAAGRGTLAPWDPPKHLVTTGLYRFSRNPMYVAVLTILAGWAVAFASRPLVAYALMMAVIFHLRVVYFEEPWLARQFGAEWDAFRSRVPRWLGSRSVRSGESGHQ